MDIVVARYKEDLSWLRPEYYANTVVYNKGPDVELPPSVRQHRLPNIGLESHTYLQYIIDHYDRLPPWVVFTQGNPTPHVDFPTFWNDLVKQQRSEPNKSSWSYEQNFNIVRHNNAQLDPYGAPLKSFWQRYVGAPPPMQMKVYWGAIFGVRREAILARPKAYYENLIQCVMTPNPEAAHFLERSWYYIFNGP